MEELSSQIWFCQLPGLRRTVAVANILQGAVYTSFAPSVEWCLQRCLQGGDAFADLACHNGRSENTTLRGNEPRVTWDKPWLQQSFGLRRGDCAYQRWVYPLWTQYSVFFFNPTRSHAALNSFVSCTISLFLSVVSLIQQNLQATRTPQSEMVVFLWTATRLTEHIVQWSIESLLFVISWKNWESLQKKIRNCFE